MICDLCVSVFQHCDSIGLRHRKLHPVPCSHIQRKHSSPKLADLSSGLHIQEIIETF